MKKRGWQFWIDRGGTFTDVIGLSPDGTMVRHKLLSENPDHYDDAATAGIEALLEKTGASRNVECIKMGTTVATNALLERRGEPTVLVITQGFGDALRIGEQNRPSIFALEICRPEPLNGRVIEADERVASDGKVLRTLNVESLEKKLRRAFDDGYRAVAVCFMHAWRHGGHEQQAGRLARQIGFGQVSLSHEVSPLMKLVARGDTTVVDAYLSPVLRRYIDGLREGLEQRGIESGRLMFMQSNGGLVDESLFRGKDSILSGPAGGVVGMVAGARDVVGSRLIGFDMGGTSTDVSLFDGNYEYAEHTEIAGVRMRVPLIRIHTIAAGGGSILHFEDNRFQVGPDSSGANPGPACYRRGGPLTITDANVVTGRVLPDYFPSVFGPTGDELLDVEAAQSGFRNLAGRIAPAGGPGRSPEAVAEGFVRVAVDNMANAIKMISVQRGRDPADFALACFGGAGGQHACQVADRLGIDTIQIHPLAGLLSAYGIGIAPLIAYRQQAINMPLGEDTLTAIAGTVAGLTAECITELKLQGIADTAVSPHTVANLRVQGTDTTLPVGLADAGSMTGAFGEAYRQRFGIEPGSPVLVIDSLRVEATGTLDTLPAAFTGTADEPPPPLSITRIYCDGGWRRAVVHDREALPPDTVLEGPALLIEAHSTTVVEPGWRARIADDGSLVLTRTAPGARPTEAGTRADPVMLEIFNNQFMNIAEQMGSVLRNTAHSVNIKERLDFSCALFDAGGRLIANAPHIPVHLGSMGDSVQAVLAAGRDTLKPGDVWMTNAPYRGGTHLPDITVITPLFSADGTSVQFVVASRAHHADIGGMTPGSMPPLSRHIDEEGVLFENFRLVGDHRLHRAELLERLREGPLPARKPEQNVADLTAQIAANEKGLSELGRLVGRYGRDAVIAYMRHVQDNAEESVRRVIDNLSDGNFCCEMDNGELIRVSIRVDRAQRSAVIDFEGTSPQSPGNLNAPVAVTRAAVLYVFRSLVAADIPLNAGCLRPLDIRVPEGSLLRPRYPAAVVAGNVETSQCVTNALYGATGRLAGSQGTMNNLSFGNERYQYYETICGGAGAGPGFDGADAVQSHMTNSRMTDPEVLESRFPVIVWEFSIRRGSGGAGRFKGGDGAIRRLEFSEAMQAAILSGNRHHGPFGLAGGHRGRPGSNALLRANGEVIAMGGTGVAEVQPGDILLIETPGGGGFGKSSGTGGQV